MFTKRFMGAVMSLCILVTLLTQWNLTKAIVFDGYLSNPYIVSENDDEMFYLTLIEGGICEWSSASPYLQEWKREQLTYPFLGVRLASAVTCATGWDVKTVSILFDYAVVFLLCLSVLLATRGFFERDDTALLAGSLYLLWPSILHVLSRPVSPQINAIFLFVAFSSLFSPRKTRIGFVFEGVCAAGLFYLYPYYWTFLLPWMGLREAWMIYRRTWTRAHLWMYLALVLGVVPFMMYSVRVHQLPYYAESMRRLGLLADRFPGGFLTLMGIVIVSILLFAIYRLMSHERRPVERERVFFLVSGLMVSVFVLTQQLVTGVQLEAGAHYTPVIQFVFALLIGFIWNELRQKMPEHFKSVFFAVSCLLLILIGVRSFIGRVQQDAFAHRANNLTYPTNTPEEQVYAWLQSKGIRDQVIASPYGMIDRLVLYTDNYVPFSSLQRLLLIPTQELIQRFQYVDVTNEDLVSQFSKDGFEVFGLTYVAPHDRAAQMNRWKRLFRLETRSAPPMSAYFDEPFYQVLRDRRSVSVEGYRMYLDRYQVRYVIYRIQQKNNPLYQSIEGEVVFSNAEYEVKQRF